jgi:hypothetical protein
MKFKKLDKINSKVDKIMNSDLSWKEKYDKIFSDDISMKVDLDYYDPDTSYEEDILAFVNAFKEYYSKELSKQ